MNPYWATTRCKGQGGRRRGGELEQSKKRNGKCRIDYGRKEMYDIECPQDSKEGRVEEIEEGQRGCQSL